MRVRLFLCKKNSTNLFPSLKHHLTIGTKWVFRNKFDEDNIIRNKVRLVAKDYNQEEGIYYNEIFAPITRLSY